MAKGLFYWYFENKEALFAELVRSMRAQLAATRAESIDPAADPLTQLRQAVECSVRFIARHTEFFTVLRMERREPTVSAILREVADADVAGVARLVAAGSARARSPPRPSRVPRPGCRRIGDLVLQRLLHGPARRRRGRAGRPGRRWVVRAVGGEAGEAGEPGGEGSQAGMPDLTVRLLPTGSRQRVRVAQTSQPIAPKGISAR